MSKCKIEITNTGEQLEVNENVELSKQLNAANSPILFGCRTGICATCLVVVEEGIEYCNDATDDEKELLEIVSEDTNARLGCLLKCHGNLKLKYIGK